MTHQQIILPLQPSFKKILGMTDQPAVHNQEVELKTFYKEQAVQVHCLYTFVDCRFYQPMQTRILLC